MHRLSTGIAVALLLFTPIAASAQHFHHHVDLSPDDQPRRSPCEKPYADAVPDASIHGVRWKISAKNATAKQFFEQGMTLLYGFNYEGALQNFRAAQRADSTLAMAPWGIALAAGPNLNITMDGPCGDLAVTNSQSALQLAENQHKAQPPQISDLEYEIIRALPSRYYGHALHNVDYAVAMRRVWARFGYDPNVSALFAESLMDLRPWALFNVAKEPAVDTDAVLQILHGALVNSPNAVGANHYWIHAVEAGPSPGDAKKSADLLKTMVPGSGHLVHMPSHTYQLIGDYGSAFDINKTAVDKDIEQYGKECPGTKYNDYVNEPKCLQWYFGHYAAHNHFFRVVAGAFLGRRADSLESARAAEKHVQKFVANEPGLQRYMTAPLMLLVAQHAWDAVLAEKIAPPECYSEPFDATGCHILRGFYHWAQGMAHAAKGNVPAALEDQRFSNLEQNDIQKKGPTGWGNNNAASVFAIANENLIARIEWALGRRDEAIEHLKLAVTAEDALTYDEPPQWFHPTRQSLGGAYLEMKRWEEARRVFKKDLEIHPLNGRSLYGLYRALYNIRPTRGEDWREVKEEFEKAWKRADYKMTEGELW